MNLDLWHDFEIHNELWIHHRFKIFRKNILLSEFQQYENQKQNYQRTKL
jgi:hypothetical protein